MNDNYNLIFIHGLEGSSKGVKATLLRDLYPGIIIPDFHGSLQERMDMLTSIVGNRNGLTIIGSSFGGLMGALFTCQHPSQVKKQILLAPALIWPDFAGDPPPPVAVPTLIIHGKHDEVIPMDAVKALAEKVFTRLEFREVDDDHGLYKTVHKLDWQEIIAD
jgi:pimeloyl-ACP methyl ester carboxylesterase